MDHKCLKRQSKEERVGSEAAILSKNACEKVNRSPQPGHRKIERQAQNDDTQNDDNKIDK